MLKDTMLSSPSSVSGNGWFGGTTTADGVVSGVVGDDDDDDDEYARSVAALNLFCHCRTDPTDLS